MGSMLEPLECPVCHRRMRPGAHRRVAFHLHPESHKPCRGGGRLPVGHTHRCECGCTWDEDA